MIRLTSWIICSLCVIVIGALLLSVGGYTGRRLWYKEWAARIIRAGWRFSARRL